MPAFNMRYLGVLLLVVIAAIVGFGPGDRRGGPDPHIEEYAHVMKSHADALVVVRYVQKIAIDGEESEEDEETVGVMIDPSGLVVCSSTGLGNFSMGGLTMTATNCKVLIGDDTEGLPATLVARDKELDLAWVRIRKPGKRVFKAIDPARHVAVRAGQRLLTLSRLGKFFDRSPEVLEGRISAVLTKPRELLAPGGVVGAMGDPVFMPDGTFVGLFVIQTPDADDADADSVLDNLTSGMMILPAATLEKATERARHMSGSDASTKPAEAGAGSPDDED